MQEQTAIQKFPLLPWIGGINTSLDAALIPPNQLTKANNIIFGVRGSRKKREGINFNWDTGATASAALIGLHDFWFGTSSGKTQRLVSITDGKKVYSYSSGTQSADLFAGTAWGSSITKASVTTLNNLAIIGVDGASNVFKKWSGSGNIADLGGSPPAGSISREHLGRLWVDNKANVDRLEYSTTANPEEWGGTGDSGAIDIGVGDGDQFGITAIFPTFQGILYVAKRTKLYKILGSTPEDFEVVKVSDTLGCISHTSIVQTDEDVFFVSEKGVHSLATTDKFGDLESTYVSVDIQGSFNDSWVRSRLPYVWGAYMPQINSIAFTVTDTEFGSTANNCIYLYNIPLKSWYRWTNLSCASLITVADSDKRRFYLGTATTRVGKTFAGTNYDTNTSGTNTSITWQTQTGFILPTGDPMVSATFYYLSLYYKPQGTYTVTATIRIDNHSVQTKSFSDTSTADLLGSTFILGSSVLGYEVVTAPYTISIDGMGRSIQILLEQSGVDESIEIQGLVLGYIPIGMQQEVLAS